MKSNLSQELEIIKGITLINLVKTEPEPKNLWNGISEKSVGLLTGISKTGKTTFAENLAFSLAVGKTNFFGYPMDGIPRKVLFVNLEESYKVFSRRNTAQLLYLTPKEVELFAENYISIPIDFPEFINDDEDWELLSEYIFKSEAEIVFIDSLTHMFNGKIEDSTAARKFVELFRKHLLSQDKTFIIVHHNVKDDANPMSQNSIAGSRVIPQFFNYAYGFSNSPSNKKYFCKLYNKFFENDDTIANVYSINSNNKWLESTSTINKNALYYESNSTKKNDLRLDDTNRNLIYKYFLSKSSQDSQDSLIESNNISINSNELMSEFVNTGNMSKDTLYNNLSKLIDKGSIIKTEKGVYSININENENSKQ